jgi:cysteine desulfurase/selenocysteine lyase
VSVTQVSNALGTVTPAAALVQIAHRHGARVLLDGAQSVSHMRVDVQALDCDFFVFSGHKVFAPHRHRRVSASARCSTPCRPGRAAAT